MMKALLVVLFMASSVWAADITITIPDPLVPRVLNAIAGLYGYEETIDGQNNPETKAQFARRMLIRHLREITVAWEIGQERRNADAVIESMIRSKSQELDF